MNSPIRSRNASPAWGAAALLAAYMAAWAFLALAVAGPASTLLPGAARPAAVERARLATAAAP